MSAYQRRKALRGTCAEHNRMPESNYTTNVTVRLHGHCNGTAGQLSFTEHHLRRNLLLLGAPRGGKTNTMSNILAQTLDTLGINDRVVIIGPREEFLRFYCNERGDAILSPLARHRGITVYWNIFSEAQYMDDEERDTLFRELSTSFVGETDGGQNEFFYDSAAQLLNGVMHNIYRMHGTTGHNGVIRNAICGSSMKKRQPELCFDGDPQFAFLETYVEGKGDAMTRSVLGFASRLADKFFSGAWGKPGDFAISGFIRRRNTDGCRVLFIEYDVANGRSMDPIYSAIIDLALKSALANERHNGNTYFFIDELPLLKLEYIKTATAFGAGQGCSLICAAQNVSQIYHRYGVDGGNELISCFGNLFSFKNNDGATRELLHNRFGESIIEGISSNGYTVHKEITTAPVVDDVLMNSLGTGQAVVGLATVGTEADPPPFVFGFDYFQ